MSQTPIRRLDAREPEFLSTLDALLAFEAEADGRIDAAVTEILQAVRTTGDAAVVEYTRRFDGLDVQSMVALELPKSELQLALDSLRPEQQVVGDAAGRQQLLLLGNLVPADDPCDHRDDNRRGLVALTVLGQHRLRGGSILLGMDLGQPRTETRTRLAANQQQAPRRKLAVIGHANGGSEQLIELGRIRRGFAELPRGHRQALFEKVQ